MRFVLKAIITIGILVNPCLALSQERYLQYCALSNARALAHQIEASAKAVFESSCSGCSQIRVRAAVNYPTRTGSDVTSSALFPGAFFQDEVITRASDGAQFRGLKFSATLLPQGPVCEISNARVAIATQYVDSNGIRKRLITRTVTNVQGHIAVIRKS